jgi:hypothetical protein
LVQAGTLQAHLLEILQEKLNLFDLIVGETGLILGDRFVSEDLKRKSFAAGRIRRATSPELSRLSGKNSAAADPIWKRLSESTRHCLRAITRASDPQ